jgi:hypothetical protein
MANYSVNNSFGGTLQATTSSYKTLVQVNAATATELRRGKVFDVMFGTLGTPADQTYQFDISRTTASGTATTITPASLDVADGAACTAAFANYTAEPTYTSSTSLFTLGINQRASYRWVAAPGSELVWPATASNGLGLRAVSASGGTVTATGQLLFLE